MNHSKLLPALAATLLLSSSGLRAEGCGLIVLNGPQFGCPGDVVVFRILAVCDNCNCTPGTNVPTMPTPGAFALTGLSVVSDPAAPNWLGVFTNVPAFTVVTACTPAIPVTCTALPVPAAAFSSAVLQVAVTIPPTAIAGQTDTHTVTVLFGAGAIIPGPHQVDVTTTVLPSPPCNPGGGGNPGIELRQDDGTTDFTSRGSLGPAVEGFALMRHDIWGVQETETWRTVMQDQNCATQETWEFALFGESAATPGTADETSVLASTGPFLSPGGQPAGACAWLYTVTLNPPLAHGTHCTGDGIFVGTFLPLAGAWVADGSSTHISIANAGGSAEFPNGAMLAQYPPAAPGAGPTAVFGSEAVLGTGAGANTQYAGTWRLYNRNTLTMNGVAFDVRGGAVESAQSAGLYASVPAVGPQNFGMAGRYPDFVDQTGSAPAREDDLLYRSDHGGLVSGVEQLFLAESTLRCSGLLPIDFAGSGRLEVNPQTALFTLSPALHPAVPVVANVVDHPLDLDAAGLRAAFATVPAGTGALEVFYQAVRIDLGTGEFRISSLRRWRHDF